VTRLLVYATAFAFTACAAHASAKTFFANDYGAKGDGSTLDTLSIQKAMDAAAESGGTIRFKPGIYLTGSLFVKSGTRLEIGEGVTLIGSQKLDDYSMLPTRVAGIEMTWPAALINVRNQQHVTIRGKGTIDGNGPTWWKSYWDLRARYEPRGLRWAEDRRRLHSQQRRWQRSIDRRDRR
jgi:polygalacturonase